MSEQRPAGRFEELMGGPIAPPSPIPRDAQPFQGHRAGLVTRFIADAIDFAVLVVILFAIYGTVSTARFLYDPRSFTWPNPEFGHVLVIGAFVLWLYLTVGWWLTGRSYGKHVMGLRVVSRDGDRLNVIGSAVRAGFCVVFPLGLFWVLVSPANRSVQDVVIRSSVTYDWSAHRQS